MNKYKPAVPKHVLYILAGMLWTVAGVILLQYAIRWLHEIEWKEEVVLGVAGLITAVVFFQKSFKMVVGKNIARLHALPQKPCVFAFTSWKSYLLIALMMTMGMLLRHSLIPKYYLVVPYEAMGGALLIGSFSFYRSRKHS